MKSSIAPMIGQNSISHFISHIKQIYNKKRVFASRFCSDWAPNLAPITRLARKAFASQPIRLRILLKIARSHRRGNSTLEHHFPRLKINKNFWVMATTTPIAPNNVTTTERKKMTWTDSLTELLLDEIIEISTDPTLCTSPGSFKTKGYAVVYAAMCRSEVGMTLKLSETNLLDASKVRGSCTLLVVF